MKIYQSFILFLAIFLISFIAWRGYLVSKNVSVLKSGTELKSLSSTSLNIVSTPIKIKVPKISVEATIESVGLDNQGRMDVPKNVVNVAWYNLGVKPGEKGNSVFAGHYDKPDGSPSVFFKLDRLKKGDSIEVVDQTGYNLEFVVTETRIVPTDKFPLQEVFGQTDKIRVNLITCGGEWNKEKKEYSERTIVFAELKTF
jgi:LPXTG-site transpeptidase (sortase) family protein